MKKAFIISGLVGFGLLLAILIFNYMLSSKQIPLEVVSSQPNAIREQETLELQLLSDYSNGDYTLQAPYIVQDPYGNSPLTALVLFETTSNARVSVLVKGKDKYTDFSYQINTLQTHHEIPIIGLYPGIANEVELTITTDDGITASQSLVFQTEPLTNDFPARSLIVSRPEKMEPGWTLVNSETYKYILDVNGDIRWFLSFKSNNILTILPNGNFLMAYLPTPPYSFGDPPDKLVETNLLGKFSYLYFTPLIHHEIIAYHDSYLATVDDKIYLFDPKVGTLENESLPLWQFFSPNRIFEYIEDSKWLHVNALVTGGDLDDDILVSARNQHAVILVDYLDKTIKWILGPPDDWPSEYQEYLFEAKGEDFEWFWMQHTPQVLPDLDKNPDTIDILLFDNGAFRNGLTDLPENQQYSRLVHYRIDLKKHTVEQIWEYGKERGFELFSEIKGSSYYLAQTGHYLGTFAEVRSKWDVNRFDGVIIEVTEEKEPVFEIRLTNTRSIYRSERVRLEKYIPKFILGNKPGVYLKNDYPYKIYDYPIVTNSPAALDYSHSLYRLCFEKLGNNCQIWINRAQRYGLIKANRFLPLSIQIDSIDMVDTDVHLNGTVKFSEGQITNLYLLLDNKTEMYTFDISSAWFSNPGDEGAVDFYVNYLNTSNLPDGDYKVSFFTESPQGTYVAPTNYILRLSGSQGTE